MNLTFSKSYVYGTRYFLYKYNNYYSKLVKVNCCRYSGYEEINKKNSFIVNKDEIERVSLSRTKKSIKEIALCNNFEYFLTLTINSDFCNRFSLQECQHFLKKIFKSYKRKYNDFKYIVITEKHKDGAFHFHGLVKGLGDKDLYINKNGYISSIHFDKMGFNSFSKIKDYNACCHYITKYISKNCVKNDHNQIYFCSRNLKRAKKIELGFVDLDKWDFDNKYCSIKNIYNN